MPLETKRRRFGRFIGLKDCESPAAERFDGGRMGGFGRDVDASTEVGGFREDMGGYEGGSSVRGGAGVASVLSDVSMDGSGGYL